MWQIEPKVVEYVFPETVLAPVVVVGIARGFFNPTCSLSTKITEKSLKNAVISG
jgi:hypothetical protein